MGNALGSIRLSLVKIFPENLTIRRNDVREVQLTSLYPYNKIVIVRMSRGSPRRNENEMKHMKKVFQFLFQVLAICGFIAGIYYLFQKYILF